MLPLEVSGDKAFGLCFPLAQAHPLKWLSRISSISEAPCTAKDILGIRAHKTQCSKLRRQFVDLQTSGLGTSSPTLWEWSCGQTQWDTCLCTQGNKPLCRGFLHTCSSEQFPGQPLHCNQRNPAGPDPAEGRPPGPTNLAMSSFVLGAVLGPSHLQAALILLAPPGEPF